MNKWKYIGNWIVSFGDGNSIDLYKTAYADEDLDLAEARARLIAAAPELLEELKKAAESLRIASEAFGSEKLLSDCMSALAAIVKATGKE